MTTLYGIKNCDSVKKAKRWLEQENIDFTFHDFKSQGIDEDTVKRWISIFGLDRVINRRGTTWRQLDDNVKQAVNEENAIELIHQHTSLVKRPVLENGPHALIGFKADEYLKIYSK